MSDIQTNSETGQAPNDLRPRARSKFLRKPPAPNLVLAAEEEMRILTALLANLAVHHETLDDPELMIVNRHAILTPSEG